MSELRVKAEEQMMLDSFGAQYQEYMKNTGGVLPKMEMFRDSKAAPRRHATSPDFG